MNTDKKTLKVCTKGHKYYKSTDCPTCPVCENERRPQSGFLSTLSAPARRALEQKGVQTVVQLSALSEKEIMALHGIGQGAIQRLKEAMQQQGLVFRRE